jgi:hypothetical protein
MGDAERTSEQQEAEALEEAPGVNPCGVKNEWHGYKN